MTVSPAVPLEHTPVSTPSRPSRRRLIGIDIARAAALVGMFTQHVDLSDADGQASTGWVGWFFTESAGRASVVFFLLSGISLALIAQAGSASASDSALRRRGALLVVGGFALTLTIWDASILQHYGVAFLLAPWLLRLSQRGLAAITAAALLAGPVVLLALQGSTGAVLDAVTLPVLSQVVEGVWDTLVSGSYPMVLWIGFFTLGMLVGRLDLHAPSLLRRILGGAVAATVIVGSIAAVLVDLFGEPDTFGDVSSWTSLYDVTGHSGMIGWTMQTSAIALAITSAALLFPQRWAATLNPLTRMGTMSLTAYLVHILLIVVVFDPFVYGTDLSVVAKEWVVLGLIMVMVATCSIFHAWFGIGPSERLMKWLSVGRGVAVPSRVTS